MISQQPPPVKFYKGEDFYIPSFQVLIGEKPLERQIFRDITQVTYTDSIDKIDTFQITINNWDAKKRDFKYSNENTFNPGKRIELYMGYLEKGSMRKMITGEITSLTPTFPAQGTSTLAISGQNLAHRLMKGKQRSQAYINKTDNEIATEIGGRLGVHIDTSSQGPAQTVRNKYLFQDNLYDLLFLMGRARAIGYDLFVVEDKSGKSKLPGTLVFKPSTDVMKTTYELKYGLGLNEFSPHLTTHNQVEKVTVNGWDSVNKKKISVTVDRKQINYKGVGTQGGQEEIDKSFTNQEEVISDRPVSSEAEARQFGTRTLLNIANEMVTGSGSVVGLPSLRAGCTVRLEGLGKRFNGTYFVTSTTHTIGDGGYTTRFECRRQDP